MHSKVDDPGFRSETISQGSLTYHYLRLQMRSAPTTYTMQRPTTTQFTRNNIIMTFGMSHLFLCALFYDSSSISYGDVAFFVMDTRRHRSIAQDTSEEERTMLGQQQISALHAWLGKVNQTATFKFIVSSVPFTSLWQHDAQWDSWAGFAFEKEKLLETIHTVPNVIILSGDRHEFAAIEFNSPSAVAYPVMEFSTSPLSMFYVPLVQSLKPESKRHVEKKRLEWDDEVNELREIVELVPEEKVLKYIPTGNYKW